MTQNATPTPEQILLGQRLQLVNNAIALKPVDRVPILAFVNGLPHHFYGKFKNAFYDFPAANEAVTKFHQKFQPDAAIFLPYTSGRANELAGSTMFDWPGRPGTRVPDTSSQQILEQEYMFEDEYSELLGDYTGFIIKKYLPRVYSSLGALADFSFVPSNVQGVSPIKSLYTKEMLDVYATLGQVAAAQGEANAASAVEMQTLTSMGFPPFLTGSAEAPYDILGDFFRGTMGIMEDLLNRPDDIKAACDFFADMQIKELAKIKDAPLPVKRIFIPLHKGMDGFMSDKQYEELYWKPLQKVVLAIVDMGMTPYVYTEGKYDTRVEYLADVPKGKVLYHFEKADMVRTKKILGDIACLSGFFSGPLLYYGKRQQVIDEVKRVIDICAPGGGYIFDADVSLDNAKYENVEAMFETVREYGRY